MGLGLALVGCSGGEETSASGFSSAPVSASAPMTGETSGGMGTTTAPTTGESPTTGGSAETATGSSTGGSSGAESSSGAVQTSTGEPGSSSGGGDSSSSGGDSSTGAPGVCGDGMPDPGEACDDGNADNTDACVGSCVAAKCGDTFVQAGVEVCDGNNLPNATCGADCKSSCTKDFGDCNAMAADGCEATLPSDNNNCGKCGMVCGGNTKCSGGLCVGVAMEFGPEHTFQGLKSNHYITQGSCSTGGGNAADADYFCKHFYGANCAVKPGYVPGATPFPAYPKMHKRGGCTTNGLDIPNTTCDGGPCKIGDWAENTTGLTNLVCTCM